jgi:pyruvate kinase
VSPEQTTIRRLALYWGCYPHFISETRNTDERIEKAAAAAVETGDVSKGDLIVITTGHPVYAAGTTNMVRVKQV